MLKSGMLQRLRPGAEKHGAHGYSMGYNYNGRLRHAELLLQEDGSVKMIRRAETPADYFATFDFCHIMDKYLNKDK